MILNSNKHNQFNKNVHCYASQHYLNWACFFMSKTCTNRTNSCMCAIIPRPTLPFRLSLEIKVEKEETVLKHAIYEMGGWIVNGVSRLQLLR